MGGACCSSEPSPGDGRDPIMVSVSGARGAAEIQLQADEESFQLARGELGSWQVVYGTRYPVHSEKTTDVRKMIGTKQPGTVVRGRPDGEWLVLADEPGFMRIVGVGTGMLVLERLGDPAQRNRAPQQAEVSESQAQEPLGTRSASDICMWRVVYKIRFPVHSDKSTQATFLGTKKPGELVRGRRDGDWVALVDEPGFMRINAVGTGHSVLVKEGEREPQQPRPDDVNEAGLQTEILPVEETVSEELEGESPQAERKVVRAEILAGHFRVVIDTANTTSKLGVDCLATQRSGCLGLKILVIGDGLISQWNENHPGQGLRVGDVILVVNGVQGDAPELYGAIMQDMETKRTLDLVIVREQLSDSRAKKKAMQMLEPAEPDHRKDNCEVDSNKENGISSVKSQILEDSSPDHAAAPYATRGLRIRFGLLDGSTEDLTFTHRPLGLDFILSNPIPIKSVQEGRLGDQLGVKPGWLILGIDGNDVTGHGLKHTFELLRLRAGLLPELY